MEHLYAQVAKYECMHFQTPFKMLQLNNRGNVKGWESANLKKKLKQDQQTREIRKPKQT